MQLRLYCPVLLGLAMLVAFPIDPGAKVPSATSADREALAAVVQELDAAWNACDEAFIPVQPVIRKTAELFKFDPSAQRRAEPVVRSLPAAAFEIRPAPAG